MTENEIRTSSTDKIEDIIYVEVDILKNFIRDNDERFKDTRHFKCS